MPRHYRPNITIDVEKRKCYFSIPEKEWDHRLGGIPMDELKFTVKSIGGQPYMILERTGEANMRIRNKRGRMNVYPKSCSHLDNVYERYAHGNYKLVWNEDNAAWRLVDRKDVTRNKVEAVEGNSVIMETPRQKTTISDEVQVLMSWPGGEIHLKKTGVSGIKVMAGLLQQGFDIVE